MEKYIVTKQKHWHPDIGQYESYGLVCGDDPQIAILDISPEYELVAQLVHNINEEGVDRIQLYDVVCDAIG